MSAETKVNAMLSDKAFLHLSGFIGHEWEILAYNLGLRRDQVAAIAALNRNDHKKKAFQMLKTWRDCNSKIYRENCIKALEDSGRKDLAQSIQGKGLDEALSDTALLNLSGSIGQEWELLLENLGLTNERIGALGSLHSNDQKTKIFQGLIVWRDNNNRDLIDSCIRAMENSGRKDLAQKLYCAKWPGQRMHRLGPMDIKIGRVKTQPLLEAGPSKYNDLNPNTTRPLRSPNTMKLCSSTK